MCDSNALANHLFLIVKFMEHNLKFRLEDSERSAAAEFRQESRICASSARD